MQIEGLETLDILTNMEPLLSKIDEYLLFFGLKKKQIFKEWIGANSVAFQKVGVIVYPINVRIGRLCSFSAIDFLSMPSIQLREHSGACYFEDVMINQQLDSFPYYNRWIFGLEAV